MTKKGKYRRGELVHPVWIGRHIASGHYYEIVAYGTPQILVHCGRCGYRGWKMPSRNGNVSFHSDLGDSPFGQECNETVAKQVLES